MLREHGDTCGVIPAYLIGVITPYFDPTTNCKKGSVTELGFQREIVFYVKEVHQELPVTSGGVTICTGNTHMDITSFNQTY